MTDVLKRFMTLFRGNIRSVGQWHPDEPKKRQINTLKEAPTEEHFRAHLDGVTGVGIVSIRDDGSCYWGAIDIDNHDDEAGKDLDLAEMEQRVGRHKLPLTVCRSKSGGAHLFFFGSEPLRADMVKEVLTRWATELSIIGTDCIFPKQGRLTINDEGARALGNWINLPYFGGDDTNRYAIENGQRVSVDQFITSAEARAITPAELLKYCGTDHSEAPPCLQAKMKSGGFAPGERNEGVYLIAVYSRKRNPETAMAHDSAKDLIKEVMGSNALPHREEEKTIKSALGKRYNYHCDSWRDVCDKETCRKRKFGISDLEYESMQSRALMPRFTNLVQYHNVEPKLFEITIGDEENSRVITKLTAKELSEFPSFRVIVMDQARIVLPRLKNDEWDKLLNDLFVTIRIEEVPEDSTIEGQILVRLHEFIRKSDLDSPGDEIEDRKALMRGAPVVQLLNGRRVVMFRHVDFNAYLIKMKTDVGKGLWFRVSRKLGVESGRVRVGKHVVPIWYLPLTDEVTQEQQKPHDFTPEF